MQNEESKPVWIGQPAAYTKNVLKKCGVQDCTPINTPVDVGSKLEITTDEDEYAAISIGNWKLNVSHGQY